MEGDVGKELAMPAGASPGRTPRRLGQKRVDQVQIEAIEDGAVVKQRVAEAPLGMAGKLSVA